MSDQEYESQNQEVFSQQQQRVDMASSTTKTKWGTIHFLTIVGQIEGHQILPPAHKTTKYEHVMPLLAAIEESDEVDGLLLLLNTVGGDIEAGLGIAELIAGMRKPTVSLVLGGGHSIGVPLAVSAQRSLIVPSAAMTIHPVRLNGLVIGVPQTFNYFERIQERIVQFVEKNSSVNREEFIKRMLRTGELAADVGSVIYGEEAVEMGLIDRIGGLSDALEELHQMMRVQKIERQRKEESALSAELPALESPEAENTKAEKGEKVPKGTGQNKPAVRRTGTREKSAKGRSPIEPEKRASKAK